MAVAKLVIEQRITKKVAELAELMANEFSGEPRYWLALIQRSKVYSQMIDLRTHMWSEGLMYLRDCLVEELKANGVI